jgi:hypothetical protein
MAQNLVVSDCDAEVFDCDLGRSRFLFLCMETTLLCRDIQNCFLFDEHGCESMNEITLRCNIEGDIYKVLNFWRYNVACVVTL